MTDRASVFENENYIVVVSDDLELTLLGNVYLGGYEVINKASGVTEYMTTSMPEAMFNAERITTIIGEELKAVKAQFGDARRSEIVLSTADINLEDLIVREDMVVTLSHTGYIKRQPLTDYRAQRRGGRGKQAAAIKEDDFVDRLFVANTHDYILYSITTASSTPLRQALSRAGHPATA